jgi:hypothetical protein
VHARGASLAPRLSLHAAGPEFMRAIRSDLLFGAAVDAEAAAAVTAASALPEPRRARVQEAWAAIARVRARIGFRRLATSPATAVEVAEARLAALLLAGAGHAAPRAQAPLDKAGCAAAAAAPPGQFEAALGRFALDALARVSAGDMERFDALDGLALAWQLGRLPRPTRLEVPTGSEVKA